MSDSDYIRIRFALGEVGTLVIALHDMASDYSDDGLMTAADLLARRLERLLKDRRAHAEESLK